MMPAQFLEKIQDILPLDNLEQRHIKEDELLVDFLETLVEQHKLQGVYSIVAKRLLEMKQASVQRGFS